jgi:hypothetical protein
MGYLVTGAEAAELRPVSFNVFLGESDTQAVQEELRYRKGKGVGHQILPVASQIGHSHSLNATRSHGCAWTALFVGSPQQNGDGTMARPL